MTTLHGSTRNLRLHDGEPARRESAGALHAIYACASYAVRFRFVRSRVRTEVQGFSFNTQNVRRLWKLQTWERLKLS
jgi:hypothetical protein